MNFKNLLICLILPFLFGCSRQNEDLSHELHSLNLIDRNGISETITNQERLKKFENVDFLNNQPYQKVLRVFGRDAEGNIKAAITSYHPNGQLKQYLEACNNRAFGLYQEYYLDGTLKLEAYIIGGNADLNPASEKSWLFDRCSNVWDEEGRLIAQIQYSKGELHGYSLYYHPNGNLWKRVPFEHNQMQGVFEIYLESGEIMQTSEYVKGVLSGQSKRYWEGACLASEETYDQGLLMTGTYYDKCGLPVCEIESGDGQRAVFGKEGVVELQEYHNGVLQGEIQVFDRQNRLCKVYHKKKNLKHGEYREYHDQTDIPRLSLMYYEGKIQGLCKTWYENGIQESQREISNNQKNGLATAWYKDGSLMLIEEYDHDKIIRGEYYKKGEKTPVSQIALGNGIATLFDGDGHFIRKINYHNSKPQD